jgi:hypothetical protein
MKRLIDVMQYCKTLDVTGGLKKICVEQLEIPAWKDSIDEWIDLYKQFLPFFKPTSKFRRKEESVLKEGGIDALIKHVQESDKSMERNVEFFKVFSAIMKLGCEYYEEEEFKDRLGKYVLMKIESNDFEPNYTEVPLEAIAFYCGLDCYNTRSLYFHMRARLEQENLLAAANYYNLQMYFGHDMQTNGIVWDDVRAEQLVVEFKEKMLHALKSFLLTQNVSAFLEIKGNNQQILDIQSSTDLESLKKFFNPDSTAANSNLLQGGQDFVL